MKLTPPIPAADIAIASSIDTFPKFKMSHKISSFTVDVLFIYVWSNCPHCLPTYMERIHSPTIQAKCTTIEGHQLTDIPLAHTATITSNLLVLPGALGYLTKLTNMVGLLSKITIFNLQDSTCGRLCTAC